jgi:phasin family protein
MTDTSSSRFAFPFRGLDADTFSSFLPDQDAIGTMTRGAMEASNASTRASVKGMQEAGQAILGQLKQQITLSVDTGKKLTEVGSLSEAMTVQTDFVKSAFENHINGFNELADLYTETLSEAIAPLAKQARKTAKKASKSAASA